MFWCRDGTQMAQIWHCRGIEDYLFTTEFSPISTAGADTEHVEVSSVIYFITVNFLIIIFVSF